MKLISCYIKNFGKLSNVEYKFKDGITSIIEKNGAGKSTLASFIKAMLYGMDMVKTTDKDFKDRAHYAPFNEQAYGGTLIFTHGKKEYRIERTFDVKSASKDILNIYVDKELTFFEKEIGEEILGLDRDSFDRLLFISSKDIKMASNSNIKKNLNNIIDDTVEGVDFDSIMDKLSAVEKKYGTKKGSDTSTLKEQKKELENTITNQERTSSALTSKYEERNRLNAELTVLTKKQQLVADKKQMLECWETYNKKLKAIKEKEDNLNELLVKYPNGIPTTEELTKLDTLLKKQTELAGESKGIVFNDVKKQKLDNLSSKFPKGIPSESEMDSLKQLTDEKADLLSKKYGITFSEYDNNRLNNLKTEFNKGVPTDDEITSIDDKITEYNRINTIMSTSNNELTATEKDIYNKYSNKNPEDDLNKAQNLIGEYKQIDDAMKSTPKFEETVVSAPKKSFKLPLIVLLISIVLVGAGIAMFFVMLALGIAFTAVGAIGIFASAFLYLKGKIDSNATTTESRTNAEYTKQEGLLRTKAEEIHKIITPYGIYTDSVFSDFEKFKNEYERYTEIKTKLETSSTTDKENREKLDILKKEVSQFLSLYVEYNSFNAGIQQVKDDVKSYSDLDTKHKKYVKDSTENAGAIKEKDKAISDITSKYYIVLSDYYKYNDLSFDVTEYKRLKKEYEEFQSSTSTNKDNLDSINKSINEIDDKYSLGITDETRTLNTINSEVQSINSLKGQIKTSQEDAATYKAEKGLVDGEEINTDEQLDFMPEIDELKGQIAVLDLEIDNDERDIENLEDNKQVLENIKQNIKANEHKFEILSKLEEELKRSQKALDDKYVAPIMDRFEYYSDLLGNLLEEKIEMGRDFNIVLNINGQFKSDEHLSSGQRSICALCFRLALLDNIYNGDVPFIVMDDPFVALDKENLVATAKMLEKLSNGKQIIYFSCHESRKI